MPSKLGYQSLSLNDDDDDDKSSSAITSSEPPQLNTIILNLKSPWTLIPAILALLCLLTWIPLVLLAYKTTTELALARHQLLSPLLPSSTQEYLEYKFIPGGYAGNAQAQGYGLVYNHTYCEVGLRDPDEARRRGCVFDPGQGGWIHKLCQDPEVLEWWMKLPEWEWFTDFNRTIPISQSQVWSGDLGEHPSGFLYTVDDYHFRHCEYIMRQLIRSRTATAARSAKIGLGLLALDQDHMEHCLDRLVNWNTPEIRGEQSETVHVAGFGLGGECYMPLPLP